MPPVLTLEFLSWRLATAASEEDGKAILQAAMLAIMYGLVTMAQADLDIMSHLYYNRESGYWRDMRREVDFEIKVYYAGKGDLQNG